MKKLAIFLTFVVLIFPSFSHAQTVDVPLTKAELIVELQSQIASLLNQLIVELTRQLNAKVAELSLQAANQANIQSNTLAQIQATQQVQGTQIAQIQTQTNTGGTGSPVIDTPAPVVIAAPEVNTQLEVCTDPTIIHDEHGEKAKINVYVYGDTWTTGEVNLSGVGDNQWNRYEGGVAIYRVITTPFQPVKYFSNPVFLNEVVAGTYTVTSKINYGNSQISEKTFSVHVKNCQ